MIGHVRTVHHGPDGTRWVAVETGWAAAPVTFIPAVGVRERGEQLCSTWSRDDVMGAPHPDQHAGDRDARWDEPPDVELVARLSAHYHLANRQQGDETALSPDEARPEGSIGTTTYGPTAMESGDWASNVANADSTFQGPRR